MHARPKRSSRLEHGWRFRQRSARALEADLTDVTGWREVRVPGTVLEHLLEHALIPDPFLGTNECDVQWVGESDWLYRVEFNLEALSTSEQAALHFGGLDTFACVWLNGERVLESHNMFVRHDLPVTAHLRAGNNELTILFASPWRRGLELQAAHGGVRPLWNGDPSRLYVRKAQYHYGWDWGPKLLDLGPWRAVWLEVFSARIADLDCQTSVSDDLERATVCVCPAFGGALEGCRAHVSLRDPDGSTVSSYITDASTANTLRFEVSAPQLWWPHGHGQQRRYTLAVSLERNGTVLDTRTLDLGLRRLRIVQEPVANEAGTSFYVEVNNTPIFCGGANWIPDDVMLARITPERYRARVQQALDANMVMLRVWGGGIYEAEAFFEACDELGVLVWQDFMFACGLYPAHAAFLDEVRREAEDNVRRLRHRACLALWTGNNEDYQLAHSLGLYDPDVPAERDTRFPARTIYERLLPEVLRELDPERHYQPGSPFQGRDPDDPTRGDRHAWDVWGREALPYRAYRELEGRFVSEFGMAAAPGPATLRAFAAQNNPRSQGFRHHLKASQGLERLENYLSQLGDVPDTLEEFAYATQLVQAEALDAALRIWRRRWGAPQRRAVGGALIWQLNDCWPAVSWALVDSSGSPKPAHFTVRRALEAVTVNLWPRQHTAEVWAANGTNDPLETALELRAISLEGRMLYGERRAVRLEPNATTELGTFAPQAAEPVVIAARLVDSNRVRARGTLFPEPFKHHHFKQPDLEIERLDTHRLRLQVARPAKFVWLHAPDVTWSDNGLDLLPDEPRVVHAHGLGERVAVEVRWLGGMRLARLEPHVRAAQSQPRTVND
jgi:beta-mannosidase